MEMERRIRDATRRREKDQVSPTMLFHFIPGQLVTRQHRIFSKLDPRTTGPFRVRHVTGVYRQKVQLEPIDGEASRRKKKLTVHASQLVPFDRPYIEPGEIEISPDAKPEPEDFSQDPPPIVEDPPYGPPTAADTKDSNNAEETQATPELRRSKRRRFVTINNAWELAKRS